MAFFKSKRFSWFHLSKQSTHTHAQSCVRSKPTLVHNHTVTTASIHFLNLMIFARILSALGRSNNDKQMNYWTTRKAFWYGDCDAGVGYRCEGHLVVVKKSWGDFTQVWKDMCKGLSMLETKCLLDHIKAGVKSLQSQIRVRHDEPFQCG